jgi:hypothetical protein
MSLLALRLRRNYLLKVHRIEGMHCNIEPAFHNQAPITEISEVLKKKACSREYETSNFGVPTLAEELARRSQGGG